MVGIDIGNCKKDYGRIGSKVTRRTYESLGRSGKGN